MRNMEIKAIETRYRGYRFRSRLEARWAVFFDALGIEWDYEREGYALAEHGCYLPDFWLPQVTMWAEVKPEQFTLAERVKCDALTAMTGYGCLFLDGPPSARNYYSTVLYEPRLDGDGPAKGNRIDEIDKLRVDFIVDYRYLPEHRFYSATGETWPERIAWFGDNDGWIMDAIAAARSARFEHGESGALIHRGDGRGPNGVA